MSRKLKKPERERLPKRSGPDTAEGDDIPPGPYRTTLTFDHGSGRYTPPHVIVGADGKTVAGWIPSLRVAERLRRVLDRAHLAGSLMDD